MSRRSRAIAPAFLLIALSALVAGCGDDDQPLASAAFRLDLRIADASGAPVPGLEVGLHVPIPGLEPVAAKAATRLEFAVAVGCSVRVDVDDMEGRPYQVLVRDAFGPGVYALLFGAGSPPPIGTHVYRARMTAWDDTTTYHTESVLMTLMTSFDVDQMPILGTSDADGAVRCDDRREFPFLYDIWPQMARDENGDEMGEFTPASEVEFLLREAGTGDSWVRYTAVIEPGVNRVDLVWDPQPKRGAVAAPSGLRSVEAAGRADVFRRKDLPLPQVFDLRPNYPNPFN